MASARLSPLPNGLRDDVDRRRRRFGQLPALHPSRPVEPLATAAASAATRRRDASYRRALVAGDVLVYVVAVQLSQGPATDSWPALAAIALVVAFLKLAGLYDRDPLLLRRTTLEEAPALFHAATLYTLLVVLAAPLLTGAEPDGGQLFALWASLIAGALAMRWCVRRVLAWRLAPERCLVLGSVDTARQHAQRLAASPRVNARIIGCIRLERLGGDVQTPGLGQLEDVSQIVEQHEIERVIVAPGEAESDALLDLITGVKAMGVNVSVLPRMLEVVGSSTKFDAVEGATLLGVHRFGLSPASTLTKRVVDVVGACVALVLASPLLLAIALGVRLSSEGPVLFRQTRVGRDGHRFMVLKFRSMTVGADALKAALQERNQAGNGLFKIPDDPRVTRLGRHLRRTGLDELPQLLNVLRGEMSLVGPRPLIEEEDLRVVGWHRRRLHLRPGITGPWQVLGSARIPLSEMVTIDYLYAANWSLWVDLKILLRTLMHMCARRGL